MLSKRWAADEVAYLLAVGQGKGDNIKADGAFFVHVPTLTTARAVYITVRFTAEDTILARLKHTDLTNRLVTELTERNADVLIDPNLIYLSQWIPFLEPPADELLGVNLTEVRAHSSQAFRL